MKRIFSAFVALSAITLFFAACTKTTSNSDNSMAAYSDNFTIKSADWVVDGRGFIHGLQMNDLIDRNTLDADAVLVYLSLDNGSNYNKLATTLLDNALNKYVNYDFTHGVDGNTYNVTLFAENVDGTKTSRPPDMRVKVVVIPARLIANNNVDTSDFNAVKATFKLKD